MTPSTPPAGSEATLGKGYLKGSCYYGRDPSDLTELKDRGPGAERVSKRDRMRKNGSREGERVRDRPAGLPEAPGEGRQIKEAVFLLKPPKAANDPCTGK